MYYSLCIRFRLKLYLVEYSQSIHLCVRRPVYVNVITCTQGDNHNMFSTEEELCRTHASK